VLLSLLLSPISDCNAELYFTSLHFISLDSNESSSMVITCLGRKVFTYSQEYLIFHTHSTNTHRHLTPHPSLNVASNNPPSDPPNLTLQISPSDITNPTNDLGLSRSTLYPTISNICPNYLIT
jgi:hypothetical protein